MHFQDLVLTLQKYWSERGCLLAQPYDLEKGAATFNPATFLRSLGPEPFNAAFIEPCRRPKDGRYGDNPNRMQHYFQFQVVMKPSPVDIVDLYLGSLSALGLKASEHDIRFVHDDWESPTLGAWGLGWEVWLDGMEITQFTYFQQVGGIDLAPVTGEITYGLERICMYLQKKNTVYALSYNDQFSYGDIYHQNEVQMSRHNFELADISLQTELFGRFEAECRRLAEADLPLAAYDYCIKASHAFNLLDARGAISVNERQGYILRVRTLAKLVAETHLKNREAMGFPLVARRHPVLEAAAQKRAEWTRRSESLSARLDKARAEMGNTHAKVPLLLELGVEEMPARVFEPLLAELPRLFDKHLKESLLEPEDLQVFVTPRRIAISVSGLLPRQGDRRLELKGPPASLARDASGALDKGAKAAEAFVKKNGIAPEALTVKDFGGTEYLYAEVVKEGRSALDLLSEAIPKIFADIPWYKTMRWGAGETAFVRPVAWLVALLGDTVIPCDFAGVSAGRLSLGHRFLAPGTVEVTADRPGYLAALRKANVMASQAERRETIARLAKETAAAAGLRLREDEALLTHVSFLVEWPVPVLGSFEEKLLEIPEEVLVSEMREHQKYFALQRPDGKLANRFLVIANMVCEDHALVREGNEKVIRSRFADAEFFLKEDRQKKLEDLLPGLEKVVFLKDLGPQGTLAAKVSRLGYIAHDLSQMLSFSLERQESVQTIAELCKCDLLTQMVGEFPELQGIMGRYYALFEGLDPLVADGIRDHYLPRNAEDTYPQSDEAAVVGLADRIETLIAMFGKGRIPTGSADPYALRRAAWSAAALIVNRRFRLDLKQVLNKSILMAFHDPVLSDKEKDGLLEKLLDFLETRMKRLFEEDPRPGLPGGFARDSLEAVAKSSLGWHDLTDYVERVTAFDAFRKKPAFAQVAETFKRVSNILKGPITGAVNAASFEKASSHPTEKALFAALETAEKEFEGKLRAGHYGEVLEAVLPLREKVAALFEAVLVNDPDDAVRRDRLLLLQSVRNLVARVADFSVVQEA